MDDLRLTHLRIPAEMRERLLAAAKATCRSLSGEILYRLTQYEKEEPVMAMQETQAAKRAWALQKVRG